MHILIIYLLLLIIDLAWWWRSDQLLRRGSVPAQWGLRVACGVFIAVQLGTLSVVMLNYTIAYVTQSSAGEWHIPRVLAGLAYIWHLVVLPAIVVVWLVMTGGQAVGNIARRWRLRHNLSSAANIDSETSGSQSVPPPLSRRLLLASLVVAPPALALMATAISMPRLSRFRLNRMTVTLPQLPAELDGLTIAHLSDMHVGYFTDELLIRDIVDSTNSLDADLVAVTGDLVNRSLKDLPIAAELIHALRGRYGVFMCEGNHDLIQDASRFRRESSAAGLPLLVNESTMLSINATPLQLLALRWGSGRNDVHPERDRSDRVIHRSAAELLQQRDPNAFSIMLAHHPHAFESAAAAGVPLTLTGHTHGGQIHVSDTFGFGPWMYRYWSGYYRQEDSACVVSNGTGNWFPIRVNAPAEIIHLTLRRG